MSTLPLLLRQGWTPELCEPILSESVIYLEAVHGVIRLTLPHPRFLAHMGATVGSMVVDQAASSADARNVYEIAVSIGTPEAIPQSAQLISREKIYDEGVGTVALTDDFFWLLFPGKISLRIARGQRRASMVVHADHESRVAGSCLLFALEDAFDLSGQFMLHAALMRLPDRDANFLMYAPSGTGKTTSALSLLAQGFGLCADDAAVLRTKDGQATGWGFPRHLKVHHHTVSMLPWLAPLFTNQWNKEGEQPLARQALASAFRVIDRDPQPVAGIFSLMRAEGVSRCAAEPLSPLDAVVELTADNVRFGASGLLPLQERRLDGLIQLASTLPVFRLRVGSDLETLGPTIRQALSSPVH